MKQFIRDYLTFNRRERNGVFVLLLIIVSLIIYLNVSQYFVEPVKVDFIKFETEIDSLNASLKAATDSTENYSKTNYKRFDKNKKRNVELFTFNPNTISDKDWQRLGLSEKQIHTIKNYLSKGGKFRKKEDLKKMYCVKEDLYLMWEPYISIPTEIKKDTFKNRYPKFEKAKTEILMVELNSADSIQLIKLKGIGPFYAKSILKYRNLLGGFATKEQLLEVWKFDKEKFDAIEKYITVDTSTIKKININTCTANELKHPYINWNIANAIISYRTKHGKFKTVEEIKKTDLVDDETLRKIAPYLIIK